ncbi:MAG: hypothetical protein KA164_15065 [Rhodoferax sp.]|jgi:hypothetical protein|nr:hypothetical protein [Rhodoferax sp.]
MTRHAPQTMGVCRRQAAALLVLCVVLLGGCAGLSGSLFGQAEPAPLFRDKSTSVQAAQDALVAGRSTREDVSAALGKAATVRFDSGFEVWAYRGVAPGSVAPGPSEFVILFGPDGRVMKSRVRAPSVP